MPKLAHLAQLTNLITWNEFEKEIKRMARKLGLVFFTKIKNFPNIFSYNLTVMFK